MENFIQKELKQGLTPYLSTAEGLGARIGMDVEILSLAAGKSLMLLDAQKETAVLVERHGLAVQPPESVFGQLLLPARLRGCADRDHGGYRHPVLCAEGSKRAAL